MNTEDDEHLTRLQILVHLLKDLAAPMDVEPERLDPILNKLVAAMHIELDILYPTAAEGPA